MKHVINILTIGILLVSCVQQNNTEQEDSTGKSNVETTIKDEKPDAELIESVPSHENKAKPVVAQKEPEKNTIEQEELALLEATKSIILRNQEIPTIRVDSTGERFEERKNYYYGVACDSDQYSMLNQFDIAFNERYPNSSERTGKYDGQIFCLKKLDGPSAEHSIIVFKRSEGGHTSDNISLVTVNDQDKRLNVLHLSYHTGWDGHETTVESYIENNLITRKIEERYGWPNAHADSLVQKQPRRVVTQEILVKENGNMEVVKETIVKYNIDELFN